MDSAEFAATCRRFGLTFHDDEGDLIALNNTGRATISYRASRGLLCYAASNGAHVVRVKTLGEALCAAFPPCDRAGSPARRWTLSVERTVATDLSGFRYVVLLYRGSLLKAKVATDAVQPFAAMFFAGEMPVEVLAGWLEDNAGV